MKSEHRDPSELSIHPALKDVPEWSQEDPEFLAVVENVREEGIQYPIIIDASGRIMDFDGRASYRAAKRLQLVDVPVRVLPAEEAHNVFIAGLRQRRHLTKSAFAYLVVPHLQGAFDRARQRRIELLKSGNRTIVSSEYHAQTVEQFAHAIGISRNTLFVAQRVWKEFTDSKLYEFPTDDGTEKLTLRQYFEPRLMRTPIGGEHENSRPIGLGAVIAAIASIRATKGCLKTTSGQLELFTAGLDLMAKRFRYWDDFDPAEKRSAEAKLLELVAAMPAEVQAKIPGAIRASKKSEAA